MALPGAMVRSVNSIATIELFGVVYAEDTFDPQATDTTYAIGTILARITATGKLAECDLGGAGGLEIPVGVLGTELISDGVPTDIPFSFISGGQVDAAKLVFTNADPVTTAVHDQLRDFGINPIQTSDLSKLDN